MGSAKLNYYHDDRKKINYISKCNLDDPDQIFLFFQELSEILNVDVMSLIKDTEDGTWVIRKDKVLKTTDKGFRMTELDHLNPILYTGCKLLTDEKWTRLVDTDDYRIFSIETGILAADYIPEANYDFQVFGLSFCGLCKLGAFQHNFKVFYKSRESCLEMLRTLEVDKPNITSLTKTRLKLMDNWEVREVDEKDEEIIIEDSTDVIGQLMDVEINDSDVLNLITSEPVGDELSGLLDFIMDTDAIYSMKTTHRVQHTRKIFINIKNLKYDLIVRQILQDMKISKQMINSANQLFKAPERKFILYSLISYYDRLYQYENQRSPGGIRLDINQDFLDKFGLSSSDEDIMLNI
jgi:hypothetical protein